MSDEEYLAPSSKKKAKKEKVKEEPAAADDSSEEYGADLMGDDADRAYLNSLTDLERETVLAERYAKAQERRGNS